MTENKLKSKFLILEALTVLLLAPFLYCLMILPTEEGLAFREDAIEIALRRAILYGLFAITYAFTAYKVNTSAKNVHEQKKVLKIISVIFFLILAIAIVVGGLDFTHYI